MAIKFVDDATAKPAKKPAAAAAPKAPAPDFALEEQVAAKPKKAGFGRPAKKAKEKPIR